MSSESKASASASTSSSTPLRAADFAAIVMDIEGTVTPVSFVTDVLFPYAARHLESYLERTWASPETQAIVDGLVKQAAEDAKAGMPGVVPVSASASAEVQRAEVVASVRWQMSENRKAGPLKTLQGLIWKAGYEDGSLTGDVYDDVVAALKQWVAIGAPAASPADAADAAVSPTPTAPRLYIYSSGSVAAQKFVFRYSRHGSLSALLQGYFDTAVGHKREKASYLAIASEIGLAPSTILFLTDIYEEAVAAREAGYKAALVLRPGNLALPADHGFPVISSFAEIAVE